MITDKEITEYYLILGRETRGEEFGNYMGGLKEYINKIAKKDNKSGDIQDLWELYLDNIEGYEGGLKEILEHFEERSVIGGKLYYKGFAKETNVYREENNRNVMVRTFIENTSIFSEKDNWEDIKDTYQKYQYITGKSMCIRNSEGINKLGVPTKVIGNETGYLLEDVLYKLEEHFKQTGYFENKNAVKRKRYWNEEVNREIIEGIKVGIHGF